MKKRDKDPWIEIPWMDYTTPMCVVMFFVFIWNVFFDYDADAVLQDWLIIIITTIIMICFTGNIEMDAGSHYKIKILIWFMTFLLYIITDIY